MTLPRAPRATYHILEIEGLRGLALTLVVIFHLFGGGRVSGGIDVFLVISGFLLTRSITRRMERDEPFLGMHFSRVLSRLVPSAVLVISFVAVATLLISPASRWLQTGRELIASTLYYENWELISSQLSYGAAGVNTSPLQHFWSLSVQGQFFLVWPFLLIGVALAARALHRSERRALLAVTVLMTVCSFAYALVLVNADQSVAYLSTWTRLWELGVGAALALVTHRFALPVWARNASAWLGLTLIVTCGLVINGATTFPGVPALWPVLGTVLVILGAGASAKFSPARLLAARPLTFLARISYPLYLWHWPLLVFYLEYRGLDEVGWKGATAIFGASIVLAWLTQRYVAEPLLLKRPPRSLARSILVPVAVVASVALVLAAGIASVERRNETLLAAASMESADHPGALALSEGVTPAESSVAFVPTVDVAEQDKPGIYRQGCVQNYRNEPGLDEVLVCKDEEAKNPRKRIVMSGGSHVLHWYPALEAIARQEGWQLDVIDKDGCRLTVRADDGNTFSEVCHSWNDKALPAIIDLKPDVVFTVGTKTPEATGSEVYFLGQVEAWNRLADVGIPVIAMRDTPRFVSSVPKCIEANNGDPTPCARARAEIFLDRDPLLDAEDLPESTVLIDLSDSFCSASSCDAVVGNILAYRDDDHITATYAKTLAPSLRSQLKEQAPWLF